MSRRFSVGLALLLTSSSWAAAAPEWALKTQETQETLQKLHSMVVQIELAPSPIQQKQWSANLVSEMNKLKSERESLLGQTGPESSLGWNTHFQNLVSNMGVLESNVHSWRPSTQWNTYWFDSRKVSTDLRRFDNLIASSLVETEKLTSNPTEARASG